MGHTYAHFRYYVVFSTKDRVALVFLLKKQRVEYDERYILD